MSVKYKRFMIWLIALYIFYIISLFSSQNAQVSSNESMSIIEKGIKILENVGVIKPETIAKKGDINVLINKIHNLIRTLAHFFIFTILGVSYAVVTNEYECGKSFLLKGLLCGICAALIDEFHQHFVPGRSSQLFDVMVDFDGVCLGFLVFIILKKYKKLNFA